MNRPPFRRLLIPSLFAALFATSGWALADPPSRVARLAYVSGAASFSPAGERDWARATVNRPLVTGDRLWVDPGARAELQLGAAAIRVGGGTSIALLNLDDRVAQVQLTQGTLNVRVRQYDRSKVYEIDTPHLAFSIRRPGNYRVHVDPDGRATMVSVRSGLAEAYGEGRAFIIGERQTFRFFGRGLRDYQTFAVLPTDEFDRWSSERDRRWDTSLSRRYVSPELIGYEDLDRNGTWRKVRDYGMVWVPNRVSADWAPYRDGHWTWVEPWGWTWIDEQPWGFAPSHYGRWARIDTGWAWVPGPATARPVYAPALVAFVGGDSFRSGGSGAGGAVGWFPLGPRDVYRPSYTVSREYFTNVNTSNAVVNRTVVTNYYGTPNPPNVTYMNQAIPGAVIAVLAAAFAQSRPVARETVTVTREMVASAPPRTFAPVAPSHASVIGAAAPSVKPPEEVQNRPVVAQVKPPPPPPSFAAKQGALAANAGKPLDTAAVSALKPTAPAPAPAVTVVAAEKPVAAPLKPASGPAPTASAAAVPAPAPAPAPAASAAAAPAPAASQPTRPARPERGASEPRDQRGAPAASAPAPVAPTAPAALPPTAAPPAASAPTGRDRRSPRADEERGARPAAEGRPPGMTPNRPALAPAPAPAPQPAPAPAPAPAPEAARPSARPPVAAPETAKPPAPASEAQRPATRERPARPGRGNEPAPAPAPAAAPAAPPPSPPPPPAAAPPTPPVPRAATPVPSTPPAAAPVPPPAAAAAERGRARASERKEAASEARAERRKRQDEEQGRKP